MKTIRQKLIIETARAVKWLLESLGRAALIGAVVGFIWVTIYGIKRDPLGFLSFIGFMLCLSAAILAIIGVYIWADDKVEQSQPKETPQQKKDLCPPTTP